MALVAVKVKLMPLVKRMPMRLSGWAPTFFSSMNSKSLRVVRAGSDAGDT